MGSSYKEETEYSKWKQSVEINGKVLTILRNG
jgi:hypothetical protein